MKLYLSIKKMNFEEDNVEHNIISGMLDKEYIGYDEIVELPDNDQFIQDTMKEKEGEIIFDIRDKTSWWGFPLYELKDGKIISFNYTQYAYFTDIDRRNMLTARINDLYNPSSEFKIIRKTLAYIMNELNLNFPDFFDIMNSKIEEIIQRNPKDEIK